MFYKAKNGRLSLDGTTMDYIVFGKGTEALIMLPGLGDGLKTVKGTAIPFAIMYKELAKRYTVYCFSRKNELADNASTRSMAEDTYKAMRLLSIEKAHVLGVSMGGMIAQHLAVDHPDAVDKLILAVTAPNISDKTSQALNRWIDMAKSGDHRSLMIDNVESIYTEEYIKKKHYRAFYPLLTHIGKPKSYSRFIIQANACLRHDATERLSEIKADTLVISGGKDTIIDADASSILTLGIPCCKQKTYDALGHGAYEEADDFIKTVIEFISDTGPN